MFPDVARLRRTRSRSICPENPDGAKGGAARATDGTGAHAARELGRGWKVSPSVEIAAGQTHELGRIDEPGRITHIWMTTHTRHWRSLVLRAYWDGADEPAVETPVGDFFAQGWGRFAQVSSQMVATNPHGGFNSYWPMPFAGSARLTLENIGTEPAVVYYQLDYEVGGDVEGTGYLHAQFRRSNPLPELTTHPILEVTGRGHYVGTYLAWGVNSNGWWGEGEVKFHLDGDTDPTIASTGTEDYFGGAWNFDVPGRGYTEFSTPFLGMPQVIRPDGLYDSQQRFGMYRWHVPDPITFETDLRVDIQALGWQSGHRYLPLRDDIASLALCYLDVPTTTRPELPSVDELAV
ncbi:glycoside hydrolase family 172 protein [Desertihabitans aurantiacus]|uniref:glycoside hydrolase family 172 protein n=1 Tax=Desertihabitans aurantiacus TaxID=2282477 RepID=UPI000DF7F37E|nr:glycoside hydrolase family 172 protein [Desertihabitans aurantiacus]